jgi:hypothetical protein
MQMLESLSQKTHFGKQSFHSGNILRNKREVLERNRKILGISECNISFVLRKKFFQFLKKV